MTPSRAAEVLRRVTPLRWPQEAREAMQMGADALGFVEWLFAADDWGSLNITMCAAKWHGEDSFLDYCRAEWEKEKGNE